MAKRTGGLSLQSLIAAVVTVIAIVLAIGFLLTANGGGEIERTTAQADAPPLFPELADQRARIERIRIRPPGDGVPGATLHRADGAWHVAEMADYPAVADRVTAFLDTLTGARQLGEAEPDDVAETMADGGETESTGWRRITLQDGDGATVLETRIGPQVSSPKARDLTATYVGGAGGNPVWLADLEVSRNIAEPQSWIDPAILAFARERIAAVRTAPLDGEPLQIRRIADATGEFEAVDLDRELKADKAWKIGDLTVPFTDLTFRQVRSAEAAGDEWPGFVKTTDGLVLRFAVSREAGSYWARFKLDASEHTATGSDEDGTTETGETGDLPERDLNALRARIQGREFQLPEYTANRMIRPRASLESDRGENANGEPAQSGTSPTDDGTSDDASDEMNRDTDASSDP
jgi:hypothetical protein